MLKSPARLAFKTFNYSHKASSEAGCDYQYIVKSEVFSLKGP